MMAALPEHSPLAGLICQVFDNRSWKRKALVKGVRLIRHDGWLKLFESTLSKLEGLWPNPVADDPGVATRLRLLGHPTSEDAVTNDDGFRLFCESAYIHTGRTSHLERQTKTPPGGLLRSRDVVPRLASDFKELFGAETVALAKTQLSLVWQGEDGGSERLCSCLEDPSRIAAENDGFPMPVYVSPSPDLAEGCGCPDGGDSGWQMTRKRVPKFGSNSGVCEGGTALLYVLGSRFCFPGLRRSYQPFFRPNASLNPEDHMNLHRGAALEPGFDTHAVLSGCRGHAQFDSKGLSCDYELLAMDAAQLLPIAAVDFALEPPTRHVVRQPPAAAMPSFAHQAASTRGFGVAGAVPGQRAPSAQSGRRPALRPPV